MNDTTTLAERQVVSESMFHEKTLLITGGTGSFGNAVLKRFLNTDIGEIRIFSRDEKKQDDMRQEYASPKLRFFLGDVRDSSGLREAMRGADYVFHAAALKQVPSCEFFPLEAVRTNVLGTENVLNAGIAAEVKKIVCLSTDKAVYPINAMGQSKALMEKVLIAKSRTVKSGKTLICGTRYGNVMASRGSVIPLFIRQIKNGLPLTVTNPDMTRFMMNLDEAIELVLFAFENAEPGDLMVKKSPACKIGDLAEALCTLFETDNEIQITGTRLGEKQYETLLTKEECASALDLDGFYRIPADTGDLNYAKYCSEGNPKIDAVREYNSENTHRLSRNELREILLGCDYVLNALKSQ
jgi:UDP-glucose 4-epimerase